MSHVSEKPSTTKTVTASVEANTQFLRSLIVQCSACRQSLDGHTYRFFSCYPALDAAEARAFAAACIAGDWATVHAMQTPSVDQEKFTVYAIACPVSAQTGGMVAMLRVPAGGTATVDTNQALSPKDFAALRALCPTCQWVTFTPALQSGQENV